MKKSINILYTTCYLDVSGVTKINFDILSSLKKNGFKVHVVTTEGKGEWDYMFEIHIAPPHDISKVPKKQKPKYFLDFLKENNIEIIFNTHSLWVYENLSYIKKELPNIKIVDSLHVLEPYYLRGGYPDISANKYVHKFIDRSILISDDLRNYIVENYDVDEKELVVIRNGVDTKKFARNKEVRDSFRKELGIDQDRKLLGFIGRFAEQKRPLMFLEIAKSILDQSDNCYFYMIGSGPMHSSIKKFIAKNNLKNKIFIFEHRGDIDTVFNSTDLLIAPSLYEGAPLTILEAISAGVPVISSQVGAIREYVDGHAALIPASTNPKEVSEFVEKSIEIINTSYNMDSAIKYMIDNYDISKTTKQYEEEFRKLINQDLA